MIVHNSNTTSCYRGGAIVESNTLGTAHTPWLVEVGGLVNGQGGRGQWNPGMLQLPRSQIKLRREICQQNKINTNSIHTVVPTKKSLILFDVQCSDTIICICICDNSAIFASSILVVSCVVVLVVSWVVVLDNVVLNAVEVRSIQVVQLLLLS